FAAGVVSFVSPCVLPLIPAYVTFLTGSSLDELSQGDGGQRRRLLLNGVFFVLGFSMVFVAMGLGASALGRFLVGNLPLLRRLGGLRSEEHTSELQSRENLVCRLLLEKKKKITEYDM